MEWEKHVWRAFAGTAVIAPRSKVACLGIVNNQWGLSITWLFLYTREWLKVAGLGIVGNQWGLSITWHFLYSLLR